MLKAILFDCDGVLADTERDGHRVAFNQAFQTIGYRCDWDVDMYGMLLKVAGGKERMRHYFNLAGWPVQNDSRESFISDLHKLKTDIYMDIVESGGLPLRPGIARLVDEALDADVMVAVCSTSNERAVNAIVETMLGNGRSARLSAILAGDIVTRKKPDPDIYLLAIDRLGIDSGECIVVEDSRNGFLAATAAGLHCVITTNGYTEGEDFTGASLVVPELGDPPDVRVTLDMLMDMAARW